MEFDFWDLSLLIVACIALTALGFININNNIVNNIQGSHSEIEYLYNDNKLIINNITVSGFSGFSMRPTIFGENTLILSNYTNQTLTAGEIIVFKTEENNSVVHRIKGLYPKYLYTQGDNNNAHEKIKYSQIKYIVIGVLFE